MKAFQVLKFSIKKILVFMTAALVACSSPHINPVTVETSKPKGARVEDEAAQAVFERIKKHPNYFEVRNPYEVCEDLGHKIVCHWEYPIIGTTPYDNCLVLILCGSPSCFVGMVSALIEK